MKEKPDLLPIRIYGDIMLRTIVQPVVDFDEKLKMYVRELTHTMYELDGVGLAANQTGYNLRLFVIDPEWTNEGAQRKPIVMINPKITSSEGEIEMEEGCLSIPNVYAKVKRPNKITITYQDINGKEHTETAEGYRAVVIQHEYDHLNGILFIDKISKLNLFKIKRKLKQIMLTAVDGINIRNDSYDPNLKQNKDERI